MTYKFKAKFKGKIYPSSLKAFTLAELIITLLIIGIIASISIPNLMQDAKEYEYKAKIKKIYSIIINAINLTETELGSPLNINENTIIRPILIKIWD